MASSIDTTVPLPHALPTLPETVNHTPWPAQNFIHVDPAGDAFHVLVCRTTYSLRGMQHDGPTLPVPNVLPPEQQPGLVTEDRHRTVLNASSTVQESDFAPYKPLCDVLLVNAQAWAPGGKAAKCWDVGLRFGQAFSKVLRVTGPRRYADGVSPLEQWRLSEPDPATQVPLCYELAYGGPNLVAAYAKAKEADHKLPELYPPNPIGCGRWGGKETRAWIEHALQVRRKAQPSPRDGPEKLEVQTANVDEHLCYRAPQIELPDRPFKAEERDYPALGFGPTGRWWRERQRLAGTHDDAWKASQWPKSPKDHDYRYWNCAPQDQQVPYPEGGEEIVLVNLTPPLAGVSQAVRFALPVLPLKALVRLQAGPLLLMPMHIDTVHIDMAQATLAVVRRVLVPADLDVRKLELGQWANESVALAIDGAAPHNPEPI